MTKLKIKLYNHETGKYETHQQPFVSGRVMYKAFEMMSKIEGYEKEDTEIPELELLGLYLDLVELAFNKPEVTSDKILDGLSAEELFPTLVSIVEDIILTEEQKKMNQENLKKVTE